MAMTMTASMANELGGTFRPDTHGQDNGDLFQALNRLYGEEETEEEERIAGGPYRRKRFVAIEEVPDEKPEIPIFIKLDGTRENAIRNLVLEFGGGAVVRLYKRAVEGGWDDTEATEMLRRVILWELVKVLKALVKEGRISKETFKKGRFGAESALKVLGSYAKVCGIAKAMLAALEEKVAA